MAISSKTNWTEYQLQMIFAPHCHIMESSSGAMRPVFPKDDLFLADIAEKTLSTHHVHSALVKSMKTILVCNCAHSQTRRSLSL